MRGQLKFLVVFLLLLSLSFTQESRAQSFGFWPGYFGTMTLNDRWGITGEIQYRAYNFKGDLQQLLTRTAVTFYPIRNNQDLQVAAGIGYIRNEPLPEDEDLIPVTEERRVYQQLISKQRFGRANILHRYRVEERFMESDFQMRYRYALQANYPLNKPSLEPKTFFLSAYNELFISNQTPMFDRNRLYGGLGYCISKSLKIETGPMWQYRENATQVQLQLMIHHNFRI